METDGGWAKVGQAWLATGRVVRANFGLQGANGTPEQPIDAVILPSDRHLDVNENEEPQHVVAVQEERDDDGKVKRRFLKLPIHVMESKQTAVEFYEDHENLVKGIGAVVVTGTLVVGTLSVRRFYHSNR